MKTLTKVKLINWHTFSNVEFPIYRNTVMTGENGTGKSTILDALQYVLTVGRCKFNKAASDIGNRTLESYMRCKIGVEGNEYLRNGDITTYIALEFYDEKTKRYQIIGTVIDLRTGGSPVWEFYQIVNTQINEVDFIENGKALTKRQFRDRLSKLGQQATFQDTRRDGERMFANALGVKLKYFELVTRALAFKAIDNVYQFIMDFLLKEDPVDINHLRLSIQSYQKLEEQLKVSKDECDFLAKIVDENQNYQDKHFDIDVIQCLKDKVAEKSLNEQMCVVEEERKKINRKLQSLQEKNIQLGQEYTIYLNQSNKLENSINQNETYRLKESLQKDYDSKINDLTKKENAYQNLVQNIQDEAVILKKLRIQKEFITYIFQKQYESEILTEYLHETINEINNKLDVVSNDLLHKKTECSKIEKEYQDKKQTYEVLKRNQLQYKKEVQQLIDLLKEKLAHHYGKEIEVKPLCEYLEIKDESWRNAIEGYLNTQRFDIIIEPEYFEYALLIYDEYKNQKEIYGVGIVDVAKLNKYQGIEINGTLAEQLECKNTYAKWYINMLLGKVHCVDDVKDLRKYSVAITRSTMLYKNYTVKALNPHVYKKPYIGLAAIKIQMLELEKEINILSNTMTELRKSLNELEELQILLRSSKADHILSRISMINEYQSLAKQIQDLKVRLEKIKIDDSIFALQEEFDDVQRKLKKVKKEQENYLEEIGNLKGILSQKESFISENKDKLQSIKEKNITYEMEHFDVSNKADQKQEAYERKYHRNFKQMENEIGLEEKKYNDQINDSKNKMIDLMKEYNVAFNIGYELSIDAMHDYEKRYYQLRDMDIVDKTEMTRQAKLKCEESFKESFISGLSEKIHDAKENIKTLNKGLAKRDFNGETYEFCVTATKKENFKDYYDIIETGKEYMANNLFSETLDDSQRRIMDELFAKLASVENDKETEQTLMEYTDYRNYLDYDIKIKYEDGSYAYFSKVNREKSGGETQTPFYVIMAASFEQIIQNRNEDEDFGCVVIFDEAFNNMDEYRIQEMIKFYNERDIQTFIAVPPSRASTIIPYVNTRLLVIKQDNQTFVEVVKDEEL